MNVLVVGLGSIAEKHIHALRQIRPDAKIHALRSGLGGRNIESVSDVFDWAEVPANLDFILISNPTSLHHKTIRRAMDFNVPLFIEKPPLMNLEGSKTLLAELKERQIETYTAFNLRFHPVILWLKENLESEKPLEIQVYCGSNLANWRPQQDYRKSYSADASMGGGVHLDLIHELDYTLWLFGTPLRSHSSASKISDLQIKSMDSARYWLEYPEMFASIILNYFRHDPKRTIEIVFSEATWSADLLKGTVRSSNGTTLYDGPTPVGDTYVRQMSYFINALETRQKPMNSLEESLETLKICLGHHE